MNTENTTASKCVGIRYSAALFMLNSYLTYDGDKAVECSGHYDTGWKGKCHQHTAKFGSHGERLIVASPTCKAS